MRKVLLSVLVGLILLGSIILSCQGIPDFVAKLRICQGNVLLEDGLYNEAVEAFSKVAINNPSMYTAYQKRALAYYGMGNYDMAMADCDRALELAWNDCYSHILRARLYYKTGQLDKAIDECNGCIARYPTVVASYVIRATINYDRQLYYEALEDCNTAILLDPNSAPAYVIRGLLHAKAGEFDKSELDKAVADFSKAIELLPDIPESYYNRGLAYKKQGDAAKAVRDFNKFIILSEDQELIQKAEQQIEEIKKG